MICNRKLTLEEIDKEIERYKLLIEMLQITIEGYNKSLQTLKKTKGEK